MPRSTRRSFLKGAAATGALALGGLPALAEPPRPNELAIARWTGELAPEAIPGAARMLTERAMAALGGMERFVSRGDRVWVKPNIGWNRAPELAANTNPDVVAALVRLCRSAGAKSVKVGDNTCHKSSQCYARSGIAAAVESAGGEMVTLDPRRYKLFEIEGQRLSQWEIFPELVEADLVINVPIAKHHGLSTVTLAMKNYMGVVGGTRSTWHQQLAGCLVDITRFMRPRLCVLDAVRVLTAHGPQGGNPADVRTLGTVAAGTDIVAIDALGAELLGHAPEDIASIRAAAREKLGTIDYRSLPHEVLELS